MSLATGDLAFLTEESNFTIGQLNFEWDLTLLGFDWLILSNRYQLIPGLDDSSKEETQQSLWDCYPWYLTKAKSPPPQSEHQNSKSLTLLVHHPSLRSFPKLASPAQSPHFKEF